MSQTLGELRISVRQAIDSAAGAILTEAMREYLAATIVDVVQRDFPGEKLHIPCKNTPLRDSLVHVAWRSGKTLEEICVEFEMSPKLAYQIIRRARKVF